MSDQVTLVEVTEKNLRDVLKLKVAPNQEGFVAPNSVSIAQAHFDKSAWFRAIEADGTFIGFVMLSDPGLTDKEITDKEREEIYLWRFMIDARYQKQGYGAAALDYLVAHARSRPGMKRLLASYVDAPGGPEDFYIRYGFRKTGNVPDGEVEIVMDL